MKIVFAFAFLLASCTHWLAGSETRIQVENETSKTISNFSVVSESGEIFVLVKDSVKKGEKSKVYESEWVGKFRFAVSIDGEMEDLGVHSLKSGKVYVTINEEDGKFTASFKSK